MYPENLTASFVVSDPLVNECAYSNNLIANLSCDFPGTTAEGFAFLARAADIKFTLVRYPNETSALSAVLNNEVDTIIRLFSKKKFEFNNPEFNGTDHYMSQQTSTFERALLVPDIVTKVSMSQSLTNFLRIFQSTVWASVIALIIVRSVMQFILQKTLLKGQGSMNKATFRKTLLSAYLFFMIIVPGVYRCGLLAHILVPFVRDIQNTQDLVNRMSSRQIDLYLLESDRLWLQKIMNTKATSRITAEFQKAVQINPPTFLASDQEATALESVRTGQSAYLGYRSALGAYAARECAVFLIIFEDVEFDADFGVILFGQNVSETARNRIDKSIQLHSGRFEAISNRYEKNFEYKRQKCYSANQLATSTAPLNMNMMSAVFIMLMVTFIASTGFLALERLYVQQKARLKFQEKMDLWKNGNGNEHRFSDFRNKEQIVITRF